MESEGLLVHSSIMIFISNFKTIASTRKERGKKGEEIELEDLLVHSMLMSFCVAA